MTDCEVLVIGGGHAGCEAAAAADRVGARVILLTSDKNSLGRMSCNPAIGGIAKGHLVREIDALDGLMAQVADRSAIQFRVLNRSKGYAVWSPRAQCDRELYSEEMIGAIEKLTNTKVVVGTALDFKVIDDNNFDISLEGGASLSAKTVVLACGTFLNGLMHFGEKVIEGGRIHEKAIIGVGSSLRKMGFKQERLKTGTPPRIDGKTIDFRMLERQDGDDDPIYFSLNTDQPFLEQKPCWITYTNEAVHETIRNSLWRSPLFSGQIKGVGPRYCPSIEDKVVRFADKPRHTIFLEPEGLHTDEYYPNGFSTSLPEEVQLKAIREIPGLKDAEITQAGYAIEYDFFPPYQLHATLETKLQAGLYFAGQINGTSGYEEAAAQGLVAGCNAARQSLGYENKLLLGRDEAYTGVLIDDLITRGTDEPYRMFTSRAEFRLQLRLDNAYQRLTQKGFKLGLVSAEMSDQIENRENLVKRIIDELKNAACPIPKLNDKKLYDYLKHPRVSIMEVFSHLEPKIQNKYQDVISQVEYQHRIEAEVKYAGYIKRQNNRAKDAKRNRTKIIPGDFSYAIIKGLSSEGREKLNKIRPDNLGEAANIPGLTPADLALLLFQLKKNSIHQVKLKNAPIPLKPECEKFVNNYPHK